MDRKIQKFVLIPQTYWESSRDNSEKTVQKHPLFQRTYSLQLLNRAKQIKQKLRVTKLKRVEILQFIQKTADNLESFFGSQIGKDYYEKQILSLLLMCSSIKIFNAETIIVNNVDTEIGVISFNSTRSQTKDIRFLHKTILKVLNLPTSYHEQKWISSLSERIHLTILYREGRKAFGLVRNLQKAGGLSRARVEFFLN